MKNSNFIELPTFKFWCQKVLPLVYDDSLSYYELLCKVVDYINNLINDQKELSDELINLQREVKKIQEWIDNFDKACIEKIVERYLATMIFVEISDEGFFIYYIPEKWEDITFSTTGLDVIIPNTEYGRLVLSY